jgi:hypothetical protein
VTSGTYAPVDRGSHHSKPELQLLLTKPDLPCFERLLLPVRRRQRLHELLLLLI